MKIKFLGTGAADWSFEHDRNKEGFRRFSSAQIDGFLLIDPGPHVLDAMKEFREDPDKILYIINTHRHSDHFNEKTVNALENAKLIHIDGGEAITLGKYIIYGYKGHHGTAKDTVHFIISDGEKKLYYGLDSAWITYNEVQGIKEHGIDYAVFDGTLGDVEGDYRIFEHNNLPMVREMKKSLAPHIKRFCISHMAKGTHLPHAELSDLMAKDGIEVAYDGYETEL